MVSKYKEVKVSILLDTEEELYHQLVAAAEKAEMPLERLVDMLLGVGSAGLLEKRLEQWRKMRNE